MISTSIKLDGEAEFKKQLGDVDRNLRQLNSDMRLTTAEFQGNANSLEALTAKNEKLNEVYEQQKAKAEGLAARIELLEKNNLGASKAADDYRAKLNNTKAAMINLEREIQTNNKYLDEARHSADRAATSIDGFGREVQQVDDQTAGFGNALSGVVSDLGKLKGAIAGGATIVAIKELGGAILDLEENTREYRQVMNSLLASGEAAGIAAEDTARRYQLLNGVMGDTQAAAEATAQLQTLQATEEQLNEATIGVIGAWSKLGGAAPIETIAESISQTVAASQATGAFADILMATGQSEDEFNEKLAATADASARLDLVLQTLAATGMKDLGESYLETNAAAIQSNQTQERLNAAYAALGETIAPLADLIRNGWAGAVEFATEKVDIAIDSVMELKSWFDKTADSIRQMSQWSGGDLWNALTTIPGQEAQAASVTGGLTGAELREQGLRATDIVSAQQATSRAATSAGEAMDRRGSITTVINIDGREVARATQPYLREEDRSNPEVVSDAL